MHVAIGACAFAAFTYSANNIDFQYYYVLFICSSTLSLYSLHRIIGNKRRAKYTYFERISVSLIHTRKYQLLSIISGILSVYLFFTLPLNYQKWIIIPSILSFLYILPIFRGKKLRDFPIIKIFMIAISWSWLCTFIPLIDSDIKFSFKLLQCISSALFIYAITIPFDIRDFEIDKNEKTITVPTKFGILKAAKSANLALIFGVIILLPILIQPSVPIKTIMSILLTFLLGILLITRTRPNSSKFHVSGLIEGLLLIPIIIQYLWEYLFLIF